VALRKFPGALALGLLASLTAHTALYGGGHAMGGSYHALLVQAALAGAIGLLILLFGLAWGAGRFAAEGSVLAARLSDRLPNFGPALAAATFWFAVAETIEPQHAGAPALAAILCLTLATWFVGALARAIAAALASLVIAVSRMLFAPRTPSWTRLSQPEPLAHRAPCARRRFARPPPIAILHCA